MAPKCEAIPATGLIVAIVVLPIGYLLGYFFYSRLLCASDRPGSSMVSSRKSSDIFHNPTLATRTSSADLTSNSAMGVVTPKIKFVSVFVFTSYFTVIHLFFFHFLLDCAYKRSSGVIEFFGLVFYLLSLTILLYVFAMRLELSFGGPALSLFKAARHKMQLIYFMIIFNILIFITGIIMRFIDPNGAPFLSLLTLGLVSSVTVYSLLVTMFLKQILKMMNYKIDHINNKTNENIKEINAAAIDLLIQYLIVISIGCASTMIFMTLTVIVWFVDKESLVVGQASYQELFIIVDCIINMNCIYFIFTFSRKHFLRIVVCKYWHRICKNRIVKETLKKQENIKELQTKKQFLDLIGKTEVVQS